MVDIESLIKSLRLSWLKRIFSDNSGAWKNYLEYILKDSGGLMLFKCNYNVKDLQITSTFYLELLKWWSELREDNALNNDWHYVIWNNRDFRIDDKPFFYKKYYDIGIWEIGDLHFDLSNTESYEQIAKNVKKTNFLEWTSMRHSIPTNLKVLNRSDSSTFNAIPSFKINGGVFDIAKKKSKDYYPFLIKKKACLPNYTQK